MKFLHILPPNPENPVNVKCSYQRRGEPCLFVLFAKCCAGDCACQISFVAMHFDSFTIESVLLNLTRVQSICIGDEIMSCCWRVLYQSLEIMPQSGNSTEVPPCPFMCRLVGSRSAMTVKAGVILFRMKSATGHLIRRWFGQDLQRQSLCRKELD